MGKKEAERKEAEKRNKDALSEEELKAMKEAKEIKKLTKELVVHRSTNDAFVQHIDDMVKRIAIERDKIEMLGMTVPPPSQAFLHQIESGNVDDNPLAFDPDQVEDGGTAPQRARTKSYSTTVGSSGFTPRGTTANPAPMFNDWDEARKLMMRAVTSTRPKEVTEEPM